MKQIIFIFVLSFCGFIFLKTAALAQESASSSQSAEGKSAEDKPVCVTRADAEKVALERIPGVISKYDRVRENHKVVHTFEIKQSSGSIVDVEVFAEDCKIFKIEADKIEGTLDLPNLNVTLADARAAAIEAVEKRVKFSRRPRVEKSNVTQDEDGKDILYIFHVKEKRTTYVVKVSGQADKAGNVNVISVAKEIDD